MRDSVELSGPARGRRSGERLRFPVGTGCVITVPPRDEWSPQQGRKPCIPTRREGIGGVACAGNWGGNGGVQHAGEGRSLPFQFLPSVRSGLAPAELQADVPGVRLLHVLFGFLLSTDEGASQEPAEPLRAIPGEQLHGF